MAVLIGIGMFFVYWLAVVAATYTFVMAVLFIVSHFSWEKTKHEFDQGGNEIMMLGVFVGFVVAALAFIFSR
ncbi:MAG: hypothetical protein Q8P76_00770 [bacterium]|nr:hypothetical protein [bacterium]